MKKLLLFLALLFQITLSFGQTCEQRLKTVIDGFNSFKSCSQRAEVNTLLRLSTTVINECPLYYAEHEAEFLKAKKHVETTYEKLGCQVPGIATNSGIVTTNSNPNAAVSDFLSQTLAAQPGNYNAQQQAILRQQQDLQRNQNLQQATNQLATGLVSLILNGQASKERKRQEALANYQADKQLIADADNGDFSKQLKLAETYVEHLQFALAEYYYGIAIQNAKEAENLRNDVLDEYITTLALQGKSKEMADIFRYTSNNHINNGKVNLAFTLLETFCEDFSAGTVSCSDSAKAEGIRALLAIQADSVWVKPIICYMQVTGEYEKYGVPKNKELGLKMLESMTKEGQPHDVALYYLGMIYLNGTTDIKKNEGKAFRYFLKSAYLKGGMRDYRQAPFHLDDTYAFINYRLLSYIKAAWFVSRSNSGIDASMAAIMRSELAHYRYMVPKSDKQYFPDLFGSK